MQRTNHLTFNVRDFRCKGSQYRFCQSTSKNDICRFGHMTLSSLHWVVNWPVFTINHTYYRINKLVCNANSLGKSSFFLSQGNNQIQCSKDLQYSESKEYYQTNKNDCPSIFGHFWATVCKTVRHMLSVRCLSCPVCNVRALWPNGWTDQDETWHAGRPRLWPHCVRWGPSSPSLRGTAPLNFRPMFIAAKRLDG